MTDLPVVGFIGLGDQGAPIARRIVDAGFPLVVWARRSASTAPFADTAATIADSAAALAAQCDVVAVCVVNDDDMRNVLIGSGVLAAMRPGAIVAIHSTLLPETVTELAALARDKGVHLLDAPVSGGSAGARAGTMTVMVGGDAEPLARARPVFESFATTVAHLGPVGAGQMMKLLNNNLCYANLVMGINALELAAQLGMDAKVAAEIIRLSSGNSVGFEILTGDMFAKITGATSNLAKDIHHLAAVAQAAGLGEPPLVEVAETAVARLSAFARAVGPVA